MLLETPIVGQYRYDNSVNDAYTLQIYKTN